MYKLEKVPFGDLEKVIVFDETSGNGFSIVPEIGGTLLEIWLGGKQILDACASPQELESNDAYKSSFLFPFPNRLRDGVYELNGKEYQFEINDKGTQTALHGLGRDVSMDILSTKLSEEEGAISLSYFYEGQEKAYPFAFLFDVTIKMSTIHGLEIEMKFTNESDQRIPVGMGWHPYFSFGNVVDTLNLQLPDCKMIDIDSRMIPTGELLDYDYFKKLRPIGKAALDNGFILEKEIGQQEVLISSNDFTMKYWQETGDNKFNFLQVYTPPSRQSIAIEPMTCNIDAFNNGDGLVILGPEEFLEARCGLKKVSK